MKNSEQTLSKKMMKATDDILENLLDAVLVVDCNGEIIYANCSAQQLFQKKSADLIGQSFGFPILPYEVQEIQLVKNAQLLTVQMLASHITWDGQKASLLSLRDITAQKKITEELEEKSKLLEQTNEENAQFASLASHDLKEPVRKIIYFTDKLLHGAKLEDKEKEQLRKVISAAKRMNALINGIADLSRVNYVQHHFEPVDLKRVLEEVCEDLELQIQEKEATIIYENLPVIEAAHDKMYQLFLNLISNSLKYSYKDRSPVIHVTSHYEEDDWVQVTFTDNGIGFNNKMASQLFQPFRRLHKKEYEGIGIGLSLCQKITDMHNGRIKAEGKEGEGAIFTILLPVQQTGPTASY